MILTKEQILLASKISATDADIRLEEFKKYNTLEPKEKYYDLNRIKAVFPNANYFDIGTVEGLHGQIDDYLLIMFRGSDSVWDWIKNFLFYKKVIPYDGTNPKIRVHSGFLKNYKSVREHVHKIVKESPVKKVVVFGHSMGGAVSVLAALDIQYNFNDVEVGCFTIGTPRIGNEYFKKSFERRLPDYKHADYGSDLVAQIPPLCFGFSVLDKFYHLGPDRRKGIGTKKDHNWHLYNNALIDEIDKIIS